MAELTNSAQIELSPKKGLDQPIQSHMLLPHVLFQQTLQGHVSIQNHLKQCNADFFLKDRRILGLCHQFASFFFLRSKHSGKVSLKTKTSSTIGHMQCNHLQDIYSA